MQNTCKFLLTGANKNNSTDGVIVSGITHILKNFFPNCKTDYITLQDLIPMEKSKLLTEKKYDMLFVCGTPWLWHNFQVSTKYKNLIRLFEAHPECKKIFLGAGSCLNISDINSDILKSSEEINGIQKLYLQCINIVRDNIAHELLQNAKVNSTLLPCPSYFCYGTESINEGLRKNNVLVYIDPRKSISESGWQCSKKLDHFNELNLYFYNQFKPKVYVANRLDIEGAMSAGLPRPLLLKNYYQTLKVMEEADYVLSSRVHCAVPGFVQGKAIGLIPIDSRSKTLEDFGCLMIDDVKDFAKLKHEKRHFLNALKTYKELLIPMTENN